MLGSLVLLAVLLAPLVVLAHRRPEPVHRPALAGAWDQLRPLAPRIVLAVIAAGFLAELIPPDQVVALLGPDSGLLGLAIATGVGAVLPGGPMVAFPLAVALFHAGAGTPQIVALVTAWSLLAVNRTLVFELPMLGWPFTARRLLASLLLPAVAGLIAAGIVAGVPGVA